MFIDEVYSLGNKYMSDSFSKEAIDTLNLKLTELKNDEAFVIKGVIVTGEGEKAFIAGADIAEMKPMTTGEANAFSELGQQVTVLFESLPFPTIAAVNGFALGGGFEMAMSCDFIYATNNAVFGQPEVKLGLIPGFGGTQRLAKIVGRAQAREMIYTGRNVDIIEAKEMGLVLRSFDTKYEMINEAMKTLKAISKNSPFAVSITKKVMNEGIDLTIAEGLQLEKRQFAAIFSSEDMREGTKAFIEKRVAKFQGK
jgi:enoyl-CoA hydratase